MTSSAPSLRTRSTLPADAVAITCAPFQWPSCTANDPTPPAPPWTSSRWPASSSAALKRLDQAVTPPIASVAAWSNETAAGLGASVVAGATAYSA